ncbi:MAG: hypothetical protein AAFU61_09995 [Pseudomonadota bacterium]
MDQRGRRDADEIAPGRRAVAPVADGLIDRLPARPSARPALATATRCARGCRPGDDARDPERPVSQMSSIAHIPHRHGLHSLARAAFTRQTLVERPISLLKDFRRVAARYDRLAVAVACACAAAVALAAIVARWI